MRRRLSGPVPTLGRVAIVAQVLGALAFVAVLLRAEGAHLPLIGGSGQWTISAAFADAAGIHGGERTPVLIAGVPAGWVTDVRFSRGLAVATLQLEPAARGVVRSDATATIEPRSALEDMTIDLSPGSSAAPPARAGMRITAARTLPTTTLDRVLAVMDTDTRAQLTILLDQLSRGVRGRGGALRDALGRLHALLSPALAVSGALAQRRRMLSSLVASVARLASTAAQHDHSLVAAIAGGDRTLSATSASQSSIAATVRALPATVATLDRALRAMRSLAIPLAPLLERAPATAGALPGAERAIRRAAPATAELLTSAAQFARRAGGELHSASEVMRELAPTASALTPSISRLQPIVDAVNSRRAGIAQLGERFSGVLSTDDANGPVLRGLGSFEPFNPADFGYQGASGAARSAVATQAAQALALTCLRGGLVACLVRYLVPGLPGVTR